MTADQIITVLVILFLLISLYKNLLGEGFTYVIGISILGITGVLTPDEMLNGFANEQIAVIILLLLIGEVIRKSPLVDSMFSSFFKRTYTYKGFITRLLFPVAGLSAFINNTPLVAIMIPYVNNWGLKNNVKPSKLLIPLSFASILGGTATLIGTSTNLVVNGMVADQNIIPEFNSLEIFDFAPVGISMIIIGGLYLLFFGYKLLPDNDDIKQSVDSRSREYFVEVIVRKGSDYNNKTITEARLRNLKGLFLAEIIRKDVSISPVNPTTVIKEGDLLVFAGNTETIADMVESNKNIVPSQLGIYSRHKRKEIIEVVVTPNSGLVGKTVKKSSFRARFDAAIIGIHRNGEKIGGKIGEVTFSAGDLLLMVAGPDFNKKLRDTNDVFLIDNVRTIDRMSTLQSVLIATGLIISVVLSTAKIVPLFTSLIVFVIVLLLTRTASPKEFYKGVNYNLIFIIALSLALGTAIIKTGIAYDISTLILDLIRPYGIITLLAGLFIITNLLSSIINNIGAVAIVLPISLSIASQTGTDPRPFVLLVAYAAAASFITPIGYQTNLMVYGPGSYKFKDFLKIGTPLTIIFMIVAVVVLTLQFGLQLN